MEIAQKFKISKKKIFIGLVIAAALTAATYYFVYASPESVTDTFDDTSKISSITNIAVCSGQLKLDDEVWTTIDECKCNQLSGWAWYVTNGREACWSKTLADGVSWSRGSGTDVDNPGTYTCSSEVTSLKDKMIAAAAGEWYKIVSNVNGVTIDSSKNGSAGYSSISALAISDCIDGTRDLCTGDGCLGTDLTTINNSLKSWASAAGKSAAPYCSNSSCGTSATNDYRYICEQTPNEDRTINCTASNVFRQNRKTCSTSENNYVWLAAAHSLTIIRVTDTYNGCSIINSYSPSETDAAKAFRAVVRP